MARGVIGNDGTARAPVCRDAAARQSRMDARRRSRSRSFRGRDAEKLPAPPHRPMRRIPAGSLSGRDRVRSVLTFVFLIFTHSIIVYAIFGSDDPEDASGRNVTTPASSKRRSRRR